MPLQGLSEYEMVLYNGSIMVAKSGERNRTISAPLAGTSYFLPAASSEGADWISARPWGDKTFFIQSDQQLSVDILNSEDGGVTFQTVQGLSITPTAFARGNLNSVETTLQLNLVQLRITTQASAPTSIVLVERFMKQ